MNDDADSDPQARIQSLRSELERERRKRERLDEFLELTADGLILHDLDGCVVDATEPACELVGRNRDELVGAHLEEFIEPFDLEIASETWKAVLRGEKRSFESRISRSDGTTFPIEVELRGYEAEQRELILGVVRDITHRRRTESMLEAREQMYRVVFRESVEAIYVADAGARRVMEANPSFCELLGYEGSEAIGLSIDEFVVDDVESIDEYVRQLRRGESISNLERTWCRADGEEVEVEVTASGLAIPETGRDVFFVVARDITEEKELQTRMVQMDRMIAMGTLAAGVGHEINNPLSYVLANVQFATRILDEHSDREELPKKVGEDLRDIQEALEEAEEGAQRIDDIVADLKTLSRSEEQQELEPVSIERVLTSSVNIVWNDIRRRARFERDLRDVPPVRGTESRLGQVFVNLLMNAAQAIPPGDADDHEVRVEAYSDADEVAVEISDTGRGIPPEEMGYIFDPFFTTKEGEEGTGLGLAISRRIVESLDGTIEVESESGARTTFTVRLQPADQLAAREADSEAQAALPDELSILVVDRNAQIGPALERLLSDNHDVHFEESWPDAKARMQAHETPDAVFCTAGMPNATAADMYQWYKRQAPELLARVIFMVGDSKSERTQRLIDRISNPIIEKPVGRENLERALEATILH